MNPLHVTGVALLALGATVSTAAAQNLTIQSRYPPLQFEGAPPGGAHPIGGPSKAFVDRANALLGETGLNFTLHVSGKVNPFDEGTVEPPAVDRREWKTLHNAVAAGPEEGGLAGAVGIPANSGLAFGEMLSGGVPFGLDAHELMGFLYGGGGLELYQSFYDEAFDGKLKVLPIGITPAQAAGFFPERLPVADGTMSEDDALAAFCNMKLIVRYPGGARAIAAEACERVGQSVDFIGRSTRCEDARAECGPQNPDNAIVNEPERLTFGGFAPGVVPHQMFANGNIDAFELNMPSGHVQFLKLAAGLAGEPNDTADLTGVTPPYFYGTSWHQPFLQAELILNKAVWDSLSEEQRQLIEMAARSSVVSTYAERGALQGDAIATLQENGTTLLRWPDALLEKLRDAAPSALDKMAEAEAADGDDTLLRLFTAMRDYASLQQPFFDFDDVSAGTANIPEQ